MEPVATHDSVSDNPHDLVVVGSGMAGMTTAAAVATAGGRVVVVERASELGGSSALSGGWVWTAADPDILIEESPRAVSATRVMLRRHDAAA